MTLDEWSGLNATADAPGNDHSDSVLTVRCCSPWGCVTMPFQMSEAVFQVAYDGEAVVNGSIDVRLLAPALLSLGELVKSSNEILNGDSGTTSLRVSSDFQTGSFEVSLILSHTLVEAVKTLFSDNPGIDAAGLFAAIFGAAKYTGKAIQGLLKLYKALKGEKPITTLIDQSTHNTIFVMGNGNEVEVEGSTAQLYASDRIQRQIDDMARPISEQRLNYLEVKKDEIVLDRLERTDLPQRLLEPGSTSDSAIFESATGPVPREILLKVTKPNFEGGRWSFSDGQSKFGAEIADVGFMQKVEGREEGFFAGDMLRALMKTSQKIAKGGKLETTHTIERVIEHIHAPRAQSLLSSTLEAPKLKENKDLPPSRE